MAWIKVEHVTPDKPEIVALADALGIDQDAAFGKCMRFWIWVDQQFEKSDALSVTENFIDRLTCCPGFAKNLIKVGWLRIKNGLVSIPHFDRHNGQSAKNRGLTAERMRKKRDAKSVTNASPEKEKEKEKEGNTPILFSHPWLSDPGFSDAWRGWIEGRISRDKKDKPTERAKELAMSRLQEFSKGDLSIAIKILNQSTERGWKGLFELQEAKHGPQNDSSRGSRRESRAERLDRDASELIREYRGAQGGNPPATQPGVFVGESGKAGG